MNDINLNIPYARIIPEKTIKRFTTSLLEPDVSELDLSPGELIVDRYQVIKVLPNLGIWKCYRVKDHQNMGCCGTCGAINPDSTIFCNRCGYQLLDSKFILLESKENLTAGMELLIKHNLNHKGILRYFDYFNWKEKYYIVAQNLDYKRLADIDSYINFSQALKWIIQLSQSINILHQHNIFNVDLSPTEIFLFIDGPRLVNFSNSIVTGKDFDRWAQSDIKSLAKTCLLLLSKIEPKDKNMPFLKSILMKAIQNGYRAISDFLIKIIELKQKLEGPERLYDTKKTVLLTDRGVSISVGMASDIGIVRSLNEDSVSALELTNILQSVSTPYGLYMVADGMGGHEAGEEASKIAVEYITRKIIGSFNGTFKPSEDKARQILEHAVFSANREIYKIAELKNNNMGTTIVIAYLANSRAFILNVGDARAYLYSNRRLKLITQDHSLVYRLYKIGQLSYDEIYRHPQSNQILCALGEPKLQQSLVNLAEKANHPYFFNIIMERGDGILLCTDGLWQMIPDHQIEEVLNNNSQPQHAVDELINLANENGGDDNISLIFVKTQ
jgi:serine/threonine protein phosphatase PrpC